MPQVSPIMVRNMNSMALRAQYFFNNEHGAEAEEELQQLVVKMRG